MTKYDMLVEAVESVLVELRRKGHSHVKGSDLKAQVFIKKPKLRRELEASWNSYLTRAAEDPNTKIERVPGQYLWQLASGSQNSLEAKARAEAEEVDAEPPEYRRREESLYPAVVAHWLMPARYRAKITADSRGGGVWGNPDVTGLKVIEGVDGEKEIEVATVEVKLGIKNWRRDFFQAVAHKRFAQRAYFAFGYPTDSPAANKVADSRELREYGEKFRVGVLAICMNEDVYKHLTDGDGGPLELDEIVILELWPAVYDAVTLDARSAFLKGLDIEKAADLHRFGTTLEGV